MVTSTTTGYLILARYNHLKRGKLIQQDRNSNKEEHEQAREAAEKLFPYDEGSVKTLPIARVRQVHTFHSAFLKELPADYRSRSNGEKLRLANDAIKRLGPDNLGIGWMAEVDADDFAWFVEQMSGQGTGSGLWQVFDVEVFPLNETRTVKNIQMPDLYEDETTADIYEFMTPRSWNEPEQ
jgi:hypothetical protein